MDFSKILKGAGDVLATVAPTLATALGGPLAGTAVGALLGALGLDDKTDATQLATAIKSATPEQLLAIKKADQDFTVKLRELDIAEFGKEVEDRDSARRRQAAMNDAFPNHLAIAIAAGFFLTVAANYGMTFAFAIYKITVLPEMLRIIDITTGAILGIFLTVVTYYYGSSKGSKEKDAALNKLTK